MRLTLPAQRRKATFGAVMLLFAGTAGAHTLAANKHAAQRDARGLLGQLRLPAGAVRVAGRPAGALLLRGPGFLAPSPELIDVHRWWRVPESMSGVYTWISKHRPRGSTTSAMGSFAKGGRTLDQAIEFSWPAVPGVLSQRSLVVNVVSLPGGFAAVRVDAGVVWLVPRPAAERVPSAARVLTVTRGAFPGWPPPLSMTVSSQSRVRSVARMLDRLQIVQPGGVIACPAILAAPPVTLTFRAHLGGPPLARASMLASGPEGVCSPISFSVRGRHEPPLLAQPSFLTRVARVLGTTLR